MSIRSLAAATLVAGVLSSAAAFAADAPAPTGPFGGNIAGSVAGVTDYRYRGISQTRKDPAVQGYLEYALPVAGDAAAVYGSLWGSNISFGGNLETDWTAGVRGAVMDGKLSYDVNALRYAYPGANGNQNLDFWEFGGKLTYDFGMVAPYVGFRWSPDFQLQSGDAEYYTAGVTVPLPFLADYKPTIVAEYNYQAIDRNARYGTPDYATWNVGFNITAWTLTWGLQYVDTDMSRRDCNAGANTCGPTGILSVTKTF